eukprot:scpid70172/ scgid2297/ 
MVASTSHQGSSGGKPCSLRISVPVSAAVLVMTVAVCSSAFMTSPLANAPPVFNYTKCPQWYELQTPYVRNNFSLDMFAGTYYELALHDYTQLPVCPKPSCMRSQKQVDMEKSMINDTFTLECVGKAYSGPLLFNFTQHRGVFSGHWFITGKVVYPDVVVAAVPDETGKHYDRVLEFQCIEELDHVVFTGINWYSRRQNYTQEYLDEFLQLARDHGLGVYMDSGLKVYIPNQTNCTYPPDNCTYPPDNCTYPPDNCTYPPDNCTYPPDTALP